MRQGVHHTRRHGWKLYVVLRRMVSRDVYFFFFGCQLSRDARRLPVINPLWRPSTSLRSSSSFRKLSMPLTSRLLRPARNPRHSRPTAPMTPTEPQRHGRLGAAGCSSGCIARSRPSHQRARVRVSPGGGECRGRGKEREWSRVGLLSPKIFMVWVRDLATV